jgi:hypothetical protein
VGQLDLLDLSGGETVEQFSEDVGGQVSSVHFCRKAVARLS